jgi:hypothetical protein
MRVCLITAHDGFVLRPFTPPFIISPDTLIIHTGSTLSGDKCPSHTTRNLFPLNCHTWNFSSDEMVLLKNIIHGRSMSGEKFPHSHVKKTTENSSHES